MRTLSALLALALLMPAGAEAQEGDAPWVRYVMKQRCYRHIDVFGAVTYPCFRRPTLVREYAPRRDSYPNHSYRLVDEHAREEVPRVHCLFEFPPVRATGDDKLDEDKAQISAQDRWSIEVETVRGTRFSDIRFAANMTAACVRKVPTSTIEKGQASLGVRHFVCSLEATPCAAPKIPTDEEGRAKRRSEKVNPAPRIEYYEAPPPPKRWYQRHRRQD